MRILKFGGKSLSTQSKCEKICRFIKSIYKREKQIIVVVSAIGNTTDNLYDVATKYGGKKIPQSELANFLSTGETCSASLFAMNLNKLNIPAKSFSGSEIPIKTCGARTNAVITYVSKTKLKKVLDSEIVAVIAGFQGKNKKGEMTTLGRGGSDTTAIALASAFCCDAEIYSDFNGIFSGDPRVLPFKKLKSVDYSTLVSMSLSGAKVISASASKLAEKLNVKIISKSSTEPNSIGTIVSNAKSNTISICSSSNLTKITVVVSEDKNIINIANIILKILKNYNFNDYIIKNNTISFLADESKKLDIINDIAEKLDLIKK